jgi:hypothetical protein
MFPLIASIFSGAMAPTPPLSVGGVPQQPVSPVAILGVIGGLAIIGGLIYYVVRR